MTPREINLTDWHSIMTLYAVQEEVIARLRRYAPEEAREDMFRDLVAERAWPPQILSDLLDVYTEGV